MIGNDKERESSTSFNMSLATLERIDILIRVLSEHMIAGSLIHIQRNIMALYKELYPFLNPEEKSESRKVFEEIKGGAMITSDGKHYSYQTGITNQMIEFDFWIREKLFEKGLLMAKSDNPETALSNM